MDSRRLLVLLRRRRLPPLVPPAGSLLPPTLEVTKVRQVHTQMTGRMGDIRSRHTRRSRTHSGTYTLARNGRTPGMAGVSNLATCANVSRRHRTPPVQPLPAPTTNPGLPQVIPGRHVTGARMTGRTTIGTGTATRAPRGRPRHLTGRGFSRPRSARTRGKSKVNALRKGVNGTHSRSTLTFLGKGSRKVCYRTPMKQHWSRS